MHKCKKHPCPKPATCKCRKVRDAQVPIIWLTGSPGAGKSVLCDRIVERFQFNSFSIGGMLRDEVLAATKIGKEIEEKLVCGELVSNDIVVNLLERKMMKVCKNSRGYVIDGYPMEQEQGNLFEQFIAPVDLIIILECGDDVALERILHRAEEAGENPRPEDNEGVAQSRIYRFNQIRNEIISGYADKLKRVNTEQRSIEDVFNEVCPMIEQTIRNVKLELTANTTAADPKCE